MKCAPRTWAAGENVSPSVAGLSHYHIEIMALRVLAFQRIGPEWRTRSERFDIVVKRNEMLPFFCRISRLRRCSRAGNFIGGTFDKLSCNFAMSFLSDFTLPKARNAIENLIAFCGKVPVWICLDGFRCISIFTEIMLMRRKLSMFYIIGLMIWSDNFQLTTFVGFQSELFFESDVLRKRDKDYFCEGHDYAFMN